MAKTTLLFGFVILMICVTLSVQQSCPVSSKVTQCSPKCLQDTECASIGGKCCPNICNTKSCVLTKNLSANSNKGSTSGGAGTYCGNVKCNAYEKCDLDRTTKRQKCVRS